MQVYLNNIYLALMISLIVFFFTLVLSSSSRIHAEQYNPRCTRSAQRAIPILYYFLFILSQLISLSYFFLFVNFLYIFQELRMRSTTVSRSGYANARTDPRQRSFCTVN